MCEPCGELDIRSPAIADATEPRTVRRGAPRIMPMCHACLDDALAVGWTIN